MSDEVACTASADDGVLSLGLRASATLAAGMEDKTPAGRPSRVKNIEQIVALMAISTLPLHHQPIQRICLERSGRQRS